MTEPRSKIEDLEGPMGPDVPEQLNDAQRDAVFDVLRVLREWAEFLIPSFTCSEAEALADLLSAFGQPDVARSLIDAHAWGDEDGDQHEQRRRELEAASS